MSAMLYWIGVVEDRHDPLMSGRCRVRIHGHHNVDPNLLPVKDLPWAQTILPVTSAAMHGIGETPLGPVEGTTVVGFFADGEDFQVPVILGTLAGFPWRKPPKKFGFRDPATTLDSRPYPSEDFPRKDLLKEPDLNRLGRRQSLSKTIVQKKKDSVEKSIPIAFSGTWNQPNIPFNPEYPYNHVTESESGHVMEVDDTKDNERLHWYHRKGTFTEIDANGTKVTKVVGDNFEIIERNSHLFIKGRGNITIAGQCNILVQADCNIQVDGNMKVHAHGNLELKSGKTITLSAAEKIDMHAGSDLHMNANASMKMRSRRGMVMTGTTKTTIASPVTEVAFIKVNGISLTPIPPRPPVFSVPSMIGSKNPSERAFSSLRLPSPKPEAPPVVVTPITEAPDMT